MDGPERSAAQPSNWIQQQQVCRRQSEACSAAGGPGGDL
jgi:hypothetical protein